MKKGILIALFAFILAPASVFADDPKIIAAKFHADWCGSCKAIAPTLAELKGNYSDEDILFITFDKTDEETSHQAALLASALGVKHIYDSQAKTGFVAVIDADSKSLITKLTKTQNAKQMGDVLDGALGYKVQSGEGKGSSANYKGSSSGSMKKGSSMKGSY